MAGGIQIPRLAEGDPGTTVGQAPVGGESIPHPGLFQPPDYSGIIHSIRAGYSEMAAFADSGQERLAIAREQANAIRSQATSNAIIQGVDLVAQGISAYGKAQQLAQDKADSMYALRVTEQYRQATDMAMSVAADEPDPTVYVGTTRGIRAELMQKFDALAQNENQRFLIQKGMLEYNILSEHATSVEWNKKRESAITADAALALEGAQNRAIYTDDPRQVVAAVETKNTVLYGRVLQAADRTAIQGGLHGIENSEKTSLRDKQWQDGVVKGRLERELNLLDLGKIDPDEYRKRMQLYEPGGVFSRADQNQVMDYQEKGNAIIAAREKERNAAAEKAAKKTDQDAKDQFSKDLTDVYRAQVAGVDPMDDPTLRMKVLNLRSNAWREGPDAVRQLERDLATSAQGEFSAPGVYAYEFARVSMGEVADSNEIRRVNGLTKGERVELITKLQERQTTFPFNTPQYTEGVHMISRSILGVDPDMAMAGAKMLGGFLPNLREDPATAQAWRSALMDFDAQARGVRPNDLGALLKIANEISVRYTPRGTLAKPAATPIERRPPTATTTLPETSQWHH